VGLPLPPFFDPALAATVYRVPYHERAAEARAWAREHALRPAAEDEKRTALLLVDVQNTFCLPEFELFVSGRSGSGATHDVARIAGFLYRALDRVTEVVATLDTHTASQIFHPVFWVDEAGGHPPPFTVVTPEDVASGRFRVNPDLAAVLGPRAGVDVSQWSRHYLDSLARDAQYPLVVWPYHAMLGGIGHALVSLVEEAVFFHQIARGAPTRFETKGQHPLTENYSVLRPEVTHDASGREIARANTELIEHLLGFDEVLVAGEAKSHCVAWTLDHLLREIARRDPRLAERVTLLEDCSSAVVVPGVVDWTEAADAAYARFAAAGMRRARSSELV
jgi:nicotinamidase-related amidase